MVVQYKPYSEYKVSEVEWLGLIPAHWHSTKIKYGYAITLGKMLQKEMKAYTDEFKPYLKAINIQPQGIWLDSVENMWFSQSDMRSLKLLNGDVLISEGGDVGRAAIWRSELPECYIQNAINRARPLRGMCSSFLYYWMAMLKSSGFIDILCNKATIAHYTAEKLESSPLFIPPYKEARFISSFLDHETAKIDTLIEKQQQLIQLLNEKRQAVISHAVTKGLTPNAKMRDSGVDWLGNVPESWTICRIKQVARLESGHTPDKKIEAYWVDCDIPWVSLNDSSQLKKVDYISDTAFYLNEKGIANSSARKLPERCVVFTRDASIGLAAITTRVMAVSQHLIAWICNEEKVVPEYLLLVFYAMEDELERYTLGATLKTIGMPDVNKLTAAFPSIEEQKQIIYHVFKAREKFDLLIAKAEYAIKIIKERRTALISAAVTGKIDVRNWITPKETQTNKEVVA
ncbi:type I restriction enzyme S subunit [Pseudomonas poae]|uniref:Type I restriction enzyme S subunit n=1 Tax=Pseudomonas poae TaxID=200451 RepID=A0A7Z1GNR9_9PSED|nr:restriction endonuclease subunit S [Pseudomonas poae]PFG61253.1 type I restriction enzyme S subunit [Pseudomonas poae]